MDDLTDEELAERLWLRCETVTVMDDGVVATIGELRRLISALRASRERGDAAWSRGRSYGQAVCESELRASRDLELENALLREALREQWESNHAEHCGDEWPHPEGARCHWPLPLPLVSQ